MITAEVERAWARARRPGPNFRLALHKAQARKSPGLTVAKLEPKLGEKNLSNKFKLGSKLAQRQFQ